MLNARGAGAAVDYGAMYEKDGFKQALKDLAKAEESAGNASTKALKDVSDATKASKKAQGLIAEAGRRTAKIGAREKAASAKESANRITQGEIDHRWQVLEDEHSRRELVMQDRERTASAKESMALAKMEDAAKAKGKADALWKELLAKKQSFVDLTADWSVK